MLILWDIEQFLQVEAARNGIFTRPLVIVRKGELIDSIPPPRPESNNVFSIMLWSLQFRYWSYVHTPSVDSPYTQVSMYVIYHRPKRFTKLSHSTGLSKGLVGIVHAFASPLQSKQNHVVITHEFLHTVGATDKYDRYGEPIFPLGYADQAQQPLLPQKIAEIMAGRIPISSTQSIMPANLDQCTIGPVTSAEINWKALS